MHRLLFWAVAVAAAAALLPTHVLAPRLVAQAPDASAYRLVGEFLIGPRTLFPEAGPSRFGAISGLAALPDGCELLAVSDDDTDSRVYRLRLRGTGRAMRVEVVREIPLERAAAAPATLDPEGIALTKGGTMLISSEGLGIEPRLPPAILEYTREGTFVRQLPVPPKFVPNVRGPLRTGVQRNGGFESLAMMPDYSRLFTANEVPLVQDGPTGAFTDGARVRIVEYVADAKSYRPSREFAYELAPLERPTFATGLVVNGLVELLAINDTELLALERGFIQARGARIGINRVRLFRISLYGATDVSSVESLTGRGDVTPVRKTLVQDFSALAGRSLRLLNLENFEGLAWVGPGSGADRRLLVVSDDNFNALQVTAFLLLEPTPAAARPSECN